VCCPPCSDGQQVMLIVDYHNMSIMDPAECKLERARHQQAIKQMRVCGINFQRLQSHLA
jgi:hypothetical protein